MSALRAEYDDAVAEGVNFLWNSSIVEIEGGDDDRLRSVLLETKKEDGSTEQHRMDADHVVMAVGSSPAARIIVSTTDGIEVDERGYVLTREEPYGMSTRPAYLQAAMLQTDLQRWCMRCATQKQVAESIARYIDAVKLLQIINQ